MNKKLIALAVAGATFAPAALAQTANPVTLYGTLRVAYESVQASGGTVPIGSRSRVNDNTSLFGIRGTEDLGGGVKAFFQLETAFKPDQNDTTFAARNSGVGLQGNFGSILLGRWDTPFKLAAGAVDVFGDVWIAGYVGVMNDRGNFDRREQNVVQYWSPNFNGFAARVSYSANEGKTQPTSATQTGQVNPSVVSWNATYNKGPFYLAYSWERHKDQFKPIAAGVGNVANAKEKGQMLAASFTFGPIKVGGLTQKYEKNSGAANVVKDQKSNMANITFTSGKNVFTYQHARSKDGDLTSVAISPDCKSNAVGYFYNMSKRTAFIAHYIVVKNNQSSRCNFGANPLTINADNDPKGLGVGFRHTF